VVLTHHTLKNRGKQSLLLGDGESPKLTPTRELGGGQVQEKERVRLNELIRKVNDLFQGDVTEGDKLVYVNDVIRGKLLESETLRHQALSNTKEQFAASPDLSAELLRAVMDAFDAHNILSAQALNSESIRCGMQDLLLNQSKLYEALRQPTLDPVTTTPASSA